MTNRSLFLITFIALVTACASPGTGPPSAADSSVSSTSVTVDAAADRIVVAEDLQFGDTSTPVISKAQKFILPIPILEGGGEPLVYPSSDSRAGTPILDWQGEPIGDRGLVFFNEADQTVQAVAGNGDGVIIINEVTAAQATALHAYIASLSSNPSDLTLEQLKQAIAFAQDELGLGDMYNSERTFIEAEMTPIDTWTAAIATEQQLDPLYGLKKRDARDINQAIYIPGSFQFQGPAATPQVFEDGGVIVQQGNSVRGVQPDVFLRTYSFSDGQPITAATDLATQAP
ncbi:MAG: hypothetical protein AAF289_02760 [Cyanobacteria bacterium P01_A01_bin.135]